MAKTLSNSQHGLRSFAASLFVGLCGLGAGIVLLSAPALAQSASSDPFRGVGSSDQDPNAFGDSGLDMFELLHRAQQGGLRDPYEFSNQQQESINSEAADFRTRQREALQQQSGSDPLTPPAVQSDETPAIE
jgi:hypothetical protein